jgi:hypothetical protein
MFVDQITSLSNKDVVFSFLFFENNNNISRISVRLLLKEVEEEEKKFGLETS